MKRKARQINKRRFEFKLPRLQFRRPAIPAKLWILIALAVVLLFVNIIFIPTIKKPSTRMKSSTVVAVSRTVRDALAQFEISEEKITLDDSLTRILIPSDFPFFGFYDVLRSELATIGASIIDCRKTDGGTVMSVGKNNIVIENLLFVTSRRLYSTQGSAAIIIDDFGYSFNSLARSFLTMQVPLTISIIPGLNYSQKVAEIASLHGKEVLVHMPMEPEKEKYRDEGFTLITGQDPGKVSLRLRQAFAQIPMAAGLNNHQGSKATADRELMEMVMQSLQGMNKFFVDSRTSPASVAYQIARSYNVPAGQNRFFLDAEDDKNFIRKQLMQMTQIAKQQGSVIAIGHVRKRTLAVLEEMLPQLKSSGITFVPVSHVLD
ncbi:divergent polysaccharide deacetylase family protein [candidate division KSB1 bacterium]|nr:divergent polysaccharide deacetylase family protein [candidate division KSB1 bacterium]